MLIVTTTYQSSRVFRNLEVFLVFVLIEDRSGENSDGR